MQEQTQVEEFASIWVDCVNAGNLWELVMSVVHALLPLLLSEVPRVELHHVDVEQARFVHSQCSICSKPFCER